jgi:acetyltransferase
MGGSSVAAGEAILNEANIPAFPYPDTATRMFNCMWRYSANLDALYEIPALGAETQEEAATRLLASSMITGVVECGRTRLSEVEARQLLAAYRIPSVETHVAVSPTAAVQSAEALGYPVVLKLYSETITHKSDVGGVHLNLQSAADVKKAYRAIESAVSAQAGTGHFAGALVQPMISNKGYEILVGSSPDQQFGPVLRFGLGGRYVEIAKDTSLALPQHLLSLLPHDETKPPCRSREIATHLLY